jgi:hypothetical protein
MTDGAFARLNSAMLNSFAPNQMFSILGTIESCDGQTLVVKSCDQGHVSFNVDEVFQMPGPVSFNFLYFAKSLVFLSQLKSFI